jgi:hypothetical protein
MKILLFRMYLHYEMVALHVTVLTCIRWAPDLISAGTPSKVTDVPWFT